MERDSHPGTFTNSPGGDQLGKLSMMGVFENLWIPSFPAVHPRVHLVVRLKGKRTEIGEHRMRIQFANEDDHEIISGDGVVTFNEPPANATVDDFEPVFLDEIRFASGERWRWIYAVIDYPERQGNPSGGGSQSNTSPYGPDKPG